MSGADAARAYAWLVGFGFGLAFLAAVGRAAVRFVAWVRR